MRTASTDQGSKTGLVIAPDPNSKPLPNCRGRSGTQPNAGSVGMDRATSPALRRNVRRLQYTGILGPLTRNTSGRCPGQFNPFPAATDSIQHNIQAVPPFLIQRGQPLSIRHPQNISAGQFFL